MLRAIAAVAALLLAAVAYYVDDLIKRRKQLDGLVRFTPADRLNAAYIPLCRYAADRQGPQRCTLHIWNFGY